MGLKPAQRLMQPGRDLAHGVKLGKAHGTHDSIRGRQIEGGAIAQTQQLISRLRGLGSRRLQAFRRYFLPFKISFERRFQELFQ